MSTTSDFIIRNFWLIVIAVALVNTIIVIIRSLDDIKKDPSLKNGYFKVYFIYFGLLVLPWLIMGIGLNTGLVSNIFYYFKPKGQNIYCYLWYFSLLILMLSGAYFIFKKDGANIIAKYQAVLNSKEYVEPQKIKQQVTIALVGFVVFSVLLFSNVINIPV